MHMHVAFLHSAVWKGRMDWEDIKTFVAVAQTGTVRSAGEALGVHHATVGRRIARLEDAASVRLFDRRPEGLALTPAGEDLLGAASRASNELDAAHRRIAGQDMATAGEVIASMGEPVASLIVAPHLPAFATAFPDVHLHISATWAIQDLARGDADVAIRADNNPPETLFGKRIGTYVETAYASPAYLAAYERRARGDPGRWIGWGGSDAQRPAWVEDTSLAGTQIWGGFQSIATQAAAAKAGLGFVAMPCFVGDTTLGLIRVDSAGLHPRRDIWVLTHPDLRRTRRVRVTMEFLEDCLRRNRPLLMGEAGPRP